MLAETPADSAGGSASPRSDSRPEAPPSDPLQAEATQAQTPTQASTPAAAQTQPGTSGVQWQTQDAAGLSSAAGGRRTSLTPPDASPDASRSPRRPSLIDSIRLRRTSSRAVPTSSSRAARSGSDAAASPAPASAGAPGSLKGSSAAADDAGAQVPQLRRTPSSPRRPRLRALSSARGADGLRRSQDSGEHAFRLELGDVGSGAGTPTSEYGVSDADADVHDPVLDVVDPEVATRRTLTNIQNEIFAPPLLRLPRAVAGAAALAIPESIRAGLTGRRLSVSTSAADAGNVAIRDAAEATALAEAQEMEEENSAEIAAAQAAAKAQAALEEGKLQRATSVKRRGSAPLIPIPGEAADASADSTAEPKAAADAGGALDADDDHPHEPTPEEEEAEREREALEEHIRILLTRKEKGKRMLKGFWKFAKTPVGALAILWMAAVVVIGSLLFVTIVKWYTLPGHTTKSATEVWNQAITALFSVVLLFGPSRIVDTWHMAVIVRLHRKAIRQRAKLGLPPLDDPNDLPRSAAFRAYEAKLEELRREREEADAAVAAGANRKKRKARHFGHAHREEDDNSDTKSVDWEDPAHRHAHDAPEAKDASAADAPGASTGASTSDVSELERAPAGPAAAEAAAPAVCPDDVSLLTLDEEKRLAHHQRVFYKLHDYYHYHESVTHRAFSIRLMVWIVLLLDLHVALQCALSGITWGINYHHRSGAAVAILMVGGFAASSVPGYLISRGGNKTKKKEVVEKMLREELEAMARKRMRKAELRRIAVERGEHTHKHAHHFPHLFHHHHKHKAAIAEEPAGSSAASTPVVENPEHAESIPLRSTAA